MQANEHFLRHRAGVLLHPTSLPSTGACGILGEDASRFIDFLADGGFSIWQMLPVQPVDEHGSPYQGSSVFAGNPRFISTQPICAKSWMTNAESNSDLERIESATDPVTEMQSRFDLYAADDDRADYTDFKLQHAMWIDDYALFMAIKQVCISKAWWQWPMALKTRSETGLREFREQHNELIEHYYFEQYLFFSQWSDLRKRANDKGVLLLGDMPMFIAHNSVDVWAHPEYFILDGKGQPAVVSGVPPDYFSSTGQRWGTPLYQWSRIAEDGFRWWIDRLQTQFELFDIVRLDHFRGFESIWEIPESCQSADGEWKHVPGHEFFQTLLNKFGPLPMIAEDLGYITPEVTRLRQDFKLPGMKVLQFAFDGKDTNPYLPHNHEPDCLVCTGTHDNNTTLGWFTALTKSQQKIVIDYMQHPDEPMPWPMIHTVLGSICHIAILPMQDLLGLDSSHRMNFPGTVKDNWQWQFEWDWIPHDLITKLRQMNEHYGRC
jgi:4-alpha-glucanotransferase